MRRASFNGQNSQLAGQISLCPDVSTGHFQKLFRALDCLHTPSQAIFKTSDALIRYFTDIPIK